jgi:beta-lactamase regulating signal transducer with metallopeptidase domain
MNAFPVSAANLPVLSQALLQTGIRLLFQSSLLLLLGMVAGRALRRNGPARQVYVYHATLAAIALCVLFSLCDVRSRAAFYMPSLPPAQSINTSQRAGSAPVQPADSYQPAAPNPVPSVTPVAENLHDARGRRVQVQMQPATTVSTTPDSWQPLTVFKDFLQPGYAPRTSFTGKVYMALLGLWALVTGLLLAWLAVCHTGIRRICRHATLAQEREANSLLQAVCAEQGVRLPTLLVSPDISSVFLAGGSRPAILLPGHYATEFDQATLKAILAHEVAHIRTGDGAWTYFTRILCALLWMQPLLWHICRLREQASEELCDYAALAQGFSPPVYARCLITLAERLQPTRWEQVASGGSVVFRSSLAQRVQRLMSEDCHRCAPVTSRFRAGVGVGSALLALILAVAVSAAPPQIDNSLQGDAGLDRKVAVTAEGVPVGDLLALMTRKTGVGISAANDLIDNKVIILGPARPLRDVLYDLAALYDGVWHTIPVSGGRSRYLLVRDNRVKSYEDTLADDVNRRVLAKINEQIQALNETPAELAKRSGNDPIRRALTDPDGRLATQVLASLSPRQLQQMAVQHWIRMPVSKLNEGLKDELEGLFNGQRVDEFNDMMMKQFHGAAIPNPSFSRDQMDGQELSFEMHNLLGPRGGATDLSIDMSVPTGLSAHAGNIRADAQFLVPAHGNPYTGKKIAPNAPLPNPDDVAAAEGDGWVDRLLSLVEKTGTPVVSDYFRSRAVSLPTGVDEVAAEPPVRALDAYCKPAGYLWWNRGKTLLFRKRDWYTQQLYEVPDRWVLAMGKHLRQEKGGLTLGDCLSVLDLSTEQIAGLNETAGWPSDRLEMAGCREMLQVLAAMHLDASKPLYSGTIGREVMPRQVAYMPNLDDPDQRSALLKFMEVRERTKITPASIKPGDFGFIVTPAGMMHDVATGIDAMIYSGHNSMTIGYRIALPITLTDDRRDKTQVIPQS